MAKIHVLDSQVAELIAAGEVVERPASIVKELVENAVDAGARRITVEIQGGGIRYIRVADDGCGIAREDVRTAFVRHATSKVLTKEDLERIVTLGFRGEALASVAAVGRVELLTRTAAETEGTYYRIEGSLEQVLEDAGCAVGTTIIVRDLFYNTPARMKFLKKDIAEGNAVAAAVDRAALTHPHICFQLIRDGQRRLLTPGKGDLYGAVYAVYGGDFAGSLIPVREALDRLPVTGFICEPGAGRATRSMQHFSVNARYIRSRTCTAALEEAYKNRLQTGHYPAGVLDIRVPWEKVDVNVHPAKIEVRFSDEKAVFDAVYSACRMTLEQADRTPPGAQSRRSAPGLFALGDFDHAQAQQRLEGSRALFKPDAGGAFVPPPAPVPIPPLRTGGDTLLAVAEQPESRDPAPREEIGRYQGGAPPADAQPDHAPYRIPPLPAAHESAAPMASEISGNAPGEARDGLSAPVKFLGELFGTYVLAQMGDSLVLVDKHAAHERHNYNRLKNLRPNTDTQLLMAPVPVVLSKAEQTALLDNRALLDMMGFAVEDFGTSSVLVREIPLVLEGCDIREVVTELAGRLCRMTADPSPAALDELYRSVACRASVMAGDHSDPEELSRLVEFVLASPDMRRCPHGRPVYTVVGKREIERMFGRLG